MNTQQQTLNKRILDVLNKCWEYNGGMCGEEFSQEKASVELEKLFLSEQIELIFKYEQMLHSPEIEPRTYLLEQIHNDIAALLNHLNNIQ